MDRRLRLAIKRRLSSEDLEDIAQYGAGTGFPGFTYYHDTVKFFKKFKPEIVRLVENISEEFGIGPVAFVKGFRHLDVTDEEVAKTLYGADRQADIQVANALVWFALEELASETQR